MTELRARVELVLDGVAYAPGQVVTVARPQEVPGLLRHGLIEEHPGAAVTKAGRRASTRSTSSDAGR